MPILRIPALLKYYLEDQTETRLPGQTVAEVLTNLSQQYPKIHSHIFDKSGKVRRHINLFVNTENIRDLDGLETNLGDNDILKILPSVTGG